MIQFNLLPDVKLEFIKTRRTKRLVILGSIIASAIAVGVFIFMFSYVNVVQTRHLSNLNDDIETYTNELKDIPDIERVITIQSQLDSITRLHEEKPAADRVMTYLTQVTPARASVGQSNVDFTDNTVTLSGNANSLATVNKFVDTLKFTEFYEVEDEDAVEAAEEETEAPDDAETAFSEVVLSSFSVGDDGASYQITFIFDPIIFDNTRDIALFVPNIISTRSEVERPTELFQEVDDPELELDNDNEAQGE